MRPAPGPARLGPAGPPWLRLICWPSCWPDRSSYPFGARARARAGPAPGPAPAAAAGCWLLDQPVRPFFCGSVSSQSLPGGLHIISPPRRAACFGIQCPIQRRRRGGAGRPESLMTRSGSGRDLSRDVRKQIITAHAHAVSGGCLLSASWQHVMSNAFPCRARGGVGGGAGGGGGWRRKEREKEGGGEEGPHRGGGAPPHSAPPSVGGGTQQVPAPADGTSKCVRGGASRGGAGRRRAARGIQATQEQYRGGQFCFSLLCSPAHYYTRLQAPAARGSGVT